MSDGARLRVLARALAESKDGEIGSCDMCDNFALNSELHVRHGSMHKRMSLCPDCDLPEKWQIKFSKTRGIRYYVYFDPTDASSGYVQWGHPTPGNPLHKPTDRGESRDRSRKRLR